MQLRILHLCFVCMLVTLFNACQIDPHEDIIGKWDLSDGGRITFYADGSGEVGSLRSTYFKDFCNCSFLICHFTWSISGDALRFEFFEPGSYSTCSRSFSTDFKFQGKNKMRINTLNLTRF